MPKELTWDDADEIGVLLSQRHPEVDPLALASADLQRYISELTEFKGDVKKSSEGMLDAVKTAWHAEFLDRTQG